MHIVGNMSDCTSAVQDSCAIFSVYQIGLAQLGVRAWAEGVESDAICSDVVSRIGLQETMLDELGCDKVYFDIPSTNSLSLESLMNAF